MREDRRTLTRVAEMFLGGRYLVAGTDRDVLPDAWRTRGLITRQWEALFPPPLVEND